jgi:hypothetical protein
MDQALFTQIVTVLLGAFAGGVVGYFSNRFTYEYQTTFGEVYKARAEVVTELYAKFTELENAIFDATHPLQLNQDLTREQKIDRMEEKLDQFQDFYFKHRIYLSERLSDDIYFKVIKGFKRHIAISRQTVLKPNNTKQKTKSEPSEAELANYPGITEFLHNDFNLIRRDLESEFRKVLGVK